MGSRTWTRPAGYVVSVGGAPLRSASPHRRSLLGDLLAARLRETAPIRRPAPPDPSDALREERQRQLEDALRQAPEGALLAARVREAAEDAAERDALDLAVTATRDRVESIERQRLTVLRLPPTAGTPAELHQLERALADARADLAAAIA
ncbi:MAG: hypothetical protein OZ948_19665, partial [Deltaproteobacteria bacterium]|nr:hypothetical protein [Deltaproteobacteria bacterium]